MSLLAKFGVLSFVVIVLLGLAWMAAWAQPCPC